MCAFDLIYFSEEVLEEDDNLYEAESLRMVYELMKGNYKGGLMS